MTRITDYDTNKNYAARVVSSRLITPEGGSEEVRSIHFEIGSSEFNFELGQSICVIVPGPHEFGNQDHLRFYSIAGLSGSETGKGVRMEICVKRCFYTDDFSGEKYKGIASNYLCDLKPGDSFKIAGPYGVPFSVPEDKSANILMIGMGTGIAPFRAFVTSIYRDFRDWDGQVRLFYGAKTGMETQYMNDHVKDATNYYQEETFKAFESVSLRPHMDEPAAIGQSLADNSKEVWKMLQAPNTYVYVAGIEKLREILDAAFIKMAGSEENWRGVKAEIEADNRWQEIIY